MCKQRGYSASKVPESFEIPAGNISEIESFEVLAEILFDILYQQT